MAFTPLTNQNYYLIAKHSGKALGFTSATAGNNLKQLSFDAQNNLQKFRFDPGDNFYWIVCAASPDNYVTIHNSSKDDGAVPIFWQWSPHTENLRFRLIPATDGYYRIQVVHSKKYLDVYGANKDHNATVVQHELTSTDNQLFKPVPVLNDAVGNDSTSFSQTSDHLRTSALAVIGMVPDYGAALKLVTGFFWSEKDQLSDLWEKMKVYVDKRIRGLIDEAFSEALKNLLAGHLKELKLIDQRIETKDKGNSIRMQLSQIGTHELLFLNSKSKRVLPYTLAMGTIVIALKHALLVNFEELFLTEPTFAELQDNARELENSIKEYAAFIADNKKQMKEARLKYIGFNSAVSPPRWYLDAYDSWGVGMLDKGPLTKSNGNFALEQRKIYIEKQYALELEEFFKVGRLWQCYLPKKAENLHTLGAEESKLIKAAFKNVFDKSIQEPGKEKQLLEEAIQQALNVTGSPVIKKYINEAAKKAIDKLENQTGTKINMGIIKESIETAIGLGIDEVFKKPAFIKAYQDGYKEAVINAAKKSKFELVMGTYGGLIFKHRFNPGGKTITRIIIHSETVAISISLDPVLHPKFEYAETICGLEVFYDGNSSGLKGKTGEPGGEPGNKKTDGKIYDLTLNGDEYISSVSGYMRNIITGIWFETQKGRTIGGGRGVKTDTRFIADLPDTLNAKLTGISGAYNDSKIEQLSFHWEYFD